MIARLKCHICCCSCCLLSCTTTTIQVSTRDWNIFTVACNIKEAKCALIWGVSTNNAGKCNFFFGFALLQKAVQCLAADIDLDSLHLTAGDS